jgi:hypothetical protein
MLQVPLVLGQTTSPAIMSGFLLMGIKGMFLLGTLLYFVFSVVIVRQIHVMKNTLITPFSPAIQMIGFGHLMTVGLVGLLFLMIL